MGNGALPHGPSYRAHPRLYLSGEAMAASLRQLLGEQRKYMEGRPRLPSTLMTRTGLWWVTRAAHSGRVYGA